MRFDQQVSLAHLAELTGIHDGAHQLARRAVLHQPALPRRFDGLPHLEPDLPDHAGLDLGIELGVRRVLVGEQLAQQALERALEVGPHGRTRRQGQIQRSKLLVGGERVAHGISRLGADAVGHFELRPELDPQLIALIPGERPGLYPVDEREVRGVVVEALALQDVVEHHQAAQVGQRLVAEEGGQPHEGPRVAAAIGVQPRQIIRRPEVRVVERKIHHHRPGARAAAQAVVGHLPDVFVEHLDLAPRPAPEKPVGREQPAVVLNAQLLEQGLADLLAPIAGVVVGLGGAQDRLDVDAGDLNRDHRVLIFGDLDLADLAGPVAALAQHVLRLAPGNRRAEGAVVQRRQARRGQALERFHLGDQRAQQQGLEQPGVVAQVPGRRRVRLAE